MGIPRVLKLNPNGLLLNTFNVSSPNNEIWTIFYNPCNGKMLGFGGGTAGLENLYVFSDTNLTNVNIINFNAASGGWGNDVADAIIDMNGDFFSITITNTTAVGATQNNYLHKSLSASNYNPPTGFSLPSGYNFYETCIPNIFVGSTCWSNQNGSCRSNILSLNTSYLYSYDGKTLKAWDKNTGAMLGQIVVNAAYADGMNRSHEGIAVDECNRVYVGGFQSVHTYSFNGSTFTSLGNITTNVPDEVYDVMLNEASSTLYVSGKGFLSTHNVASCNSMSVTITATSGCGANGSATVTVTGGTAPYTYQWSTGATTSVVTNLAPGTYTVYVQDASCIGRFASDTVTISAGSSNFTVSSNIQNVKCYNTSTGSATLNVIGGTSPYSYTWTPNGGNGNIANNLMAGNYTVNIKDASGCTTIYTVSITQPSDMTVQAVVNNSVSCYGGNDGSASVSVSGGTSPYSCTWTPTGASNFTVNNLTAGNYTIMVSDINNCVKTTTLNIIQPSSISVISNTPNACSGNVAVVNVTVTGGNGNYSYTWQPSGMSSSGSYTTGNLTAAAQVTILVSENNCPPVVKVINIAVSPSLSASGMLVTVCDKASVNIYPQITSPGNGGPYSYLWLNNGSTSTVLTVTGSIANPVQTFTVKISDGCTNPDAVAVCTVQVLPYSSPSLSVTATPLNGCEPLLVNYTASSNDTSVHYTWNFGNGVISTQNPVSVTYTSSGVYSPTVVVVNQYGCVKDTVLMNYVNVYPVPHASFECIPSTTLNVIDAMVTFSNQSTLATQYVWYFGDWCSTENSSNEVNPVHEYGCSGTFTTMLIATNEYGCSDTMVQIIWIKPEIHLYIPDCFTPNGDGLNDVFIPKGIGILEHDYRMLIFDRWGEEIFESNALHKGWDGSVKGSSVMAAEGVYVYKIYAKDVRGRAYEFVGHVTCLPHKER
ncbi:MAG: gliding motility-associated C-terminal domain-containing protein [Bacteroidota bacterium]